MIQDLSRLSSSIGHGVKHPTHPLAASEIEDSILLRSLVQGLVTIGISSVAVSAVGVTQSSLWNLLAIPLSAVGAFFSWRRRRYRNVGVKFLIAFGMLAALATFLARLLGQPGDTRMLLAELLIQLQVLHSFDLPRRKDLGYSMMIGLILLGVAATISQTLAFGPLLLLFLAVTLPVLVLDYRSRIGLLNASWRQSWPQLSLRRLGAMLALTLGLGWVIFLCLPRLPGYQIRNFPVSSTVDFQGQFDGQAIINPGYVSGGQNGNGSQREWDGDSSRDIQATGQLSGPGVVDQNAYYGFNRQMNQNLRGEMTPQMVMRVRAQAPGFWRVVTFDHYTGQGWDISRNENVLTLKRSRYSLQTILPWQPYTGRSREVIQTYTLVKDFSNLIPTLYQAKELYFPTREVGIDLDGTLRAPISLEEGMTYTVVSAVPYRDRTRLRNAPTHYPEEISTVYLQVPTNIQRAVRQQTEALLATSPNALKDPYEKALYLAQALKQRYTVQPDLPFLAADEDLVEAFLFKYQGGLPDHFSTTLTIMLRSIGIPARMAAGFGPGEFNLFTGFYLVRNTDAYAITEVYFPQYGWFAFDPIPNHELLPPTIQDYETFSALVRFWNWVAGQLPSPVSGFIEGVVQDLFGLAQQAMSMAVKLLNRGWIGVILGFAGLTALAFVAWIGWLLGLSGWRQWRLQQLPPMERLHQQMLLAFAQQGLRKNLSETPLEYAQRLHKQVKSSQAQPANEIAHAYVRWRYGGEEADLNYIQRQLKKIKSARTLRRTPSG